MLPKEGQTVKATITSYEVTNEGQRQTNSSVVGIVISRTGLNCIICSNGQEYTVHESNITAVVPERRNVRDIYD